MKIFNCPLGQEDLTNNFLKEIYDEREYDRFGISIEDGDIVLDAGANVGIFTEYALGKGASKVLAYECDESIFNYFNEKY
jgi:16S rRNA A1518/A1519 N6-dimethyltransferase RsmA/KsgA/DIM1 with predicted DNA glycosylase/AP lyase activity